MQIPLFQFTLHMGDNTLILGQRLSEWCGHAPVLEEDIAIANIALDLIGQTKLWLELAGQIEDKGRDSDQLAFRRDAWDFRNFLLLELPNGDYGQTLMRQFLFDAWHSLILRHLASSSDKRIADIANKAGKESTYHLERSTETVVGLGDGTDESHTRMQVALDRFWPYVGEMFTTSEIERKLCNAGIVPEPNGLRNEYLDCVKNVLTEATLSIPESSFSHVGGKSGTFHTEHLGHLLTNMQWLQRAYPDAKW